ncbi:MAG: L-serine ammonia-lyase, iron-sulfur-dependent, subunit alpha [Thermodesulfobacteriota bacterium]|nr:L-serine ammonia-lyase, iron-sulfur-dependent, subunit alpha [Thermodesulfobacteriota bacterium]
MEVRKRMRGTNRERDNFYKNLITATKEKEAPIGKLTLGEIIDLADQLKVRASDIVIAEAMVVHQLRAEEVIQAVLDSFKFNLLSLEVGLSKGKSFLLGSIGKELVKLRQRGTVLIGDRFIDKAVIYTLAAEVGNHQMGLQPCAGTGDSCVYTGLMKALLETKRPKYEIGQIASLIIKIGTFFKEGKKTTGCNMEGFGAGAACTAAALTELRNGSPRDVGKAIVLALSPTIAVPCTPRVIVSGLCATHIGGAVLIGNLASNLVLKTSLPVIVDVDVMLAMAASIHSAAAPVITQINLEYMRPYFKREDEVEKYVPSEIRQKEARKAEAVLGQAREEIRNLAETANPIISPFGEAVVGGSSIAVGSPTNMGRIAHELYRGEIKKISIGLTTDLFARRTINIPGILMGAVFGASTKDIKMYNKVLEEVSKKGIEIEISQIDEPEVQRISIEATEGSAMIDALNRGGGRIKLVDAKPSLEEANTAAKRLGIKLAQT